MMNQPTKSGNMHTANRKSSYAYEDLLACGHGKMFGPGNAQLPLPNMLMVDRIIDINETGGSYGKGELIAELDIKPDLWFFGCHFEGDPVMPGCLGLDAMWQLVGFYLGWVGAPGRGRALGAGEEDGHRRRQAALRPALLLDQDVDRPPGIDGGLGGPQGADPSVFFTHTIPSGAGGRPPGGR